MVLAVVEGVAARTHTSDLTQKRIDVDDRAIGDSRHASELQNLFDLVVAHLGCDDLADCSRVKWASLTLTRRESDDMPTLDNNAMCVVRPIADAEVCRFAGLVPKGCCDRTSKGYEPIEVASRLRPKDTSQTNNVALCISLNVISPLKRDEIAISGALWEPGSLRDLCRQQSVLSILQEVEDLADSLDRPNRVPAVTRLRACGNRETSSDHANGFDEHLRGLLQHTAKLR